MSKSPPAYRFAVASEAAQLEAALQAVGRAVDDESIWDIWLSSGLRAALAALEQKEEEPPMRTKTTRPQTLEARMATLQQQTVALQAENTKLKAQQELAAHQAAELHHQLEALTPAATLIERKTAQLQAAEPALSYEQAYTKVLEAEPALYRRYSEENPNEFE